MKEKSAKEKGKSLNRKLKTSTKKVNHLSSHASQLLLLATNTKYLGISNQGIQKLLRKSVHCRAEFHFNPKRKHLRVSINMTRHESALLWLYLLTQKSPSESPNRWIALTATADSRVLNRWKWRRKVVIAGRQISRLWMKFLSSLQPVWWDLFSHK